jgi:peptidoglycan/xylan/chitin deacetylase (PgdA/CDA1 family)
MNSDASGVSSPPRLRLDRMVSLALAGPIGQGLRSTRQCLTSMASASDEQTVPILMYHSIADDVETGVHPYFRTVTTAQRFAEQVQHLREQGYQGVTLAEAARCLQDPRRACDVVHKPVVLTFDDGFRDFFTTAWPVLQAVGFRATVFVSTDFIGKPFITGRPCLHAHELRELCASGIELGSHSASHKRLVDLSLQELAQEVGVSKQRLQEITGQAVYSFSYPYRFPQQNQAFTHTLAELLRGDGYLWGVTTTLGRAVAADDPLFLPRLPINDCDDLALFAAKLKGHYDWLRSGQILRKRSRAWMQKLGWHS